MAGTMRERKKNIWQFEVTIGSDYNGKPIRYFKTFHGNKREATKELNIFYNDCLNGKINKSSPILFSTLADTYYNEATAHLKRSSKVSANTVITKYLKPTFGSRKANKITRLDIQKFINSIDRSPKTVRNIYSVLREIFKFAIDMEYLTVSPCTNIKLPKLKTVESKFYSSEEIYKILYAIEPFNSGKEFNYKIAVLIAIFGGLRIGEILGLNWEDVDFQNSTISINRTRMAATGGGMYEETPKTSKSARTISLPVELMEMMKELQKQQDENDYIFTSPAVLKNESGKPLHSTTVSKWMRKICESINIEFKGMHSFRHTHASILANMQIDAMQISTRLGHSQLSTTLNIYTHLFENQDKTISQNLSNNFFKFDGNFDGNFAQTKTNKDKETYN